MSNFYLDIIKDRLYSELPASRLRRSAQTVLYEVLVGMLKLMAPVASFTAVESWEYLPKDANREDNIFVSLFPEDNDAYLQDELHATWKRLQDVRGEITKVLEAARRDKTIGHPLEAEVVVAVDADLAAFLDDKWPTLEMISNVSVLTQAAAPPAGAVASEEIDGLHVLVKAASGDKCERCWTRSETVGADSAHPTICARCLGVVNKLS
jgi:isoleucyl-tRNA synthetase